MGRTNGEADEEQADCVLGMSRRSTSHLPRVLEGATRFTEDRNELNSLWVVTTLKAHPQFWGPVRKALAQADSRFGRPRLPGDWALAYMAFVFSKIPDVQPWWGQAGHSIWRHAGFRERPSYAVTHRRFAELEQYAGAFEEVVQKLVRQAGRHTGGEVGRYLHVDGTEAETHARLKHCCPSDAPCRNRRSAIRVTAGESVNAVRDERHERAREPEPDTIALNAPDLGDAEAVVERNGAIRIKLKDCWYELLDPSAGVRAYTRGGTVRKFWVGFYNAKAVDHYTGAPVAVHITSASVQEHISYPDLYKKAVGATGRSPEAVVADRGYAISSVFEHNTRRGVASVMPWRRPNQHILSRAEMDTDRYDRHGIVRCKYCGGPTRFVRFSEKGPAGPRLWVRCTTPGERDDCTSREQTVRCAEDWRMLLPMWRTDETYLALRASHSRYERVHHSWRRRYRVGEDNHSQRPKRRGRDCQQLRANAALAIEWLIISWREGWLGSARRLRRFGEQIVERAVEAVAGLKSRRVLYGLEQPYGHKAVAAKVGDVTPTPGRTDQRSPDDLGSEDDEP